MLWSEATILTLHSNKLEICLRTLVTHLVFVYTTGLKENAPKLIRSAFPFDLVFMIQRVLRKRIARFIVHFLIFLWRDKIQAIFSSNERTSFAKPTNDRPSNKPPKLPCTCNSSMVSGISRSGPRTDPSSPLNRLPYGRGRFPGLAGNRALVVPAEEEGSSERGVLSLLSDRTVGQILRSDWLDRAHLMR